MAKARKKRSKKPLFGKLFQVRKADKKSADIEDLPALGTLALALAIVIFMLAAADVIHLDLSELKTVQTGIVSINIGPYIEYLTVDREIDIRVDAEIVHARDIAIFIE